jgi:hypothetical protein
MATSSDMLTTLLSVCDSKSVSDLLSDLQTGIELGLGTQFMQHYLQNNSLPASVISDMVNNHYVNLSNVCKDAVDNFDYLMERNWFVMNGSLHAKLILAVNLGLGDSVNALSGDFKEELDELLSTYYNSLSETCAEHVTGYEYLETRGWFMKSKECHDKLKCIVEYGLGDSVDVFADDFSEHLDEIIVEIPDAVPSH